MVKTDSVVPAKFDVIFFHLPLAMAGTGRRQKE
jgi:hypothetical protein